MPMYLLAYHGGSVPESAEEQAKVMGEWMRWMGMVGNALVDPGQPIAAASTVGANGSSPGGGANPISGYTILNAETMEAASAVAAACPVVSAGGALDVAETMDIPM